MAKPLGETLHILQAHQPELRRRGVLHAAVFGSVARGESGEESDVDILIELEPEHPMGVFAYAALRCYIQDLVGETADVVNRNTLKPLLREAILRDAVDAF
jgi:predicted nucleotidyltransferase